MRLAACLLAVVWSLSSAIPVAAQTDSVLRGTVVGHDGKPMRAAYVSLTPTQKQFVDQQGHFEFGIKEPGSYTLVVTGVHHRTLFLPVFFDKPRSIDVRIRLAASQYRDTLAELRVIGDFNTFSEDSGSVAMKLQPDGTFAATINWKGDGLSYVIQGVLDKDGTICGTQADSYALAKGHPFIDNANNQLVSVVKPTPEGTRILFDPRQLPRSTAPAAVEFADPSIPAAAIAAIDRDITIENRRVDAARAAHVAAGGDLAKFVPDRTALLRTLERSIGEATEPVVRQYLMLRYLQYPEAQSNVAMAQRVFTDIPATSRAWCLLWAGPENTFRRIAATAHSPSEERYIATVYDTNPDRNVRAAFLYIALQNAFTRKDANTVGRLHTRLLGDFGDTDYARQAVQMAPARNIQAGKPVPEFDFALLDDPATRLTPKALAGKVYLIDFWAVWCGPCVAEMPNLHAAHDTLKDKGLVIVSVSFDEKDKDVADFRRTRWPMPWFNARLGGFDTDTAKAFEVVGVPKPILVGADGRILATGSELRGDRLIETLRKALGGT